jgi:hypothetical protein
MPQCGKSDQEWVSRIMLLLLRLASFAVVSSLCTSNGRAQMFTELLPDRDVGRPARAQVITLLGIVAPGKLVTDPAITPNGPVAETLYEELRAVETPAGPAGEVVLSLRTSWDGAGRAVKEIRKDDNSQWEQITRYDDDRLISQEGTFPNSKWPKTWTYWTYNSSGKLVEFRRGRGETIENHDANFKYDSKGRLIGYECRQGAEDELFSRTELKYSPDGNTVYYTQFSADGSIFEKSTQTLDEQGHVTMALTNQQNWETKKLEEPEKITFRYDGQGRMIEQASDIPRPPKDDVENSIPPGKISIFYDDLKHTKTTSYSGQDGTISSTLFVNAAGATTASLVVSADSSTGYKIRCTDDSHGNWTACEMFASANGMERVTRKWRRTIVYR